MAGEGSTEAAHKAVPVTYRNVTKRYAGATSDAVHDLSLEVPAGELVRRFVSDAEAALDRAAAAR